MNPSTKKPKYVAEIANPQREADTRWAETAVRKLAHKFERKLSDDKSKSKKKKKKAAPSDKLESNSKTLTATAKQFSNVTKKMHTVFKGISEASVDTMLASSVGRKRIIVLTTDASTVAKEFAKDANNFRRAIASYVKAYEKANAK